MICAVPEGSWPTLRSASPFSLLLLSFTLWLWLISFLLTSFPPLPLLYIFIPSYFHLSIHPSVSSEVPVYLNTTHMSSVINIKTQCCRETILAATQGGQHGCAKVCARVVVCGAVPLNCTAQCNVSLETVFPADFTALKALRQFTLRIMTSI